MYTESFTHSKHPAFPERNEDRLVSYANSLFAVIDGVTDKSGLLHGGLTGGQIAGRLIENALRELVDSGRQLTASSREILDLINARFQASYEQLGLHDAIARDPNARFGAQLCALFHHEGHLRLLHVGDCGVRVNGQLLPGRTQPGDEVMSQLRVQIFKQLSAAGAGTEESLALARKYTVAGLQALPGTAEGPLDAASWSALRDELLDQLPARFPQLPAELVREAGLGGLKFLAAFRNSDHPLGHACIDGTLVPDTFVSDTRLDLASSDVIELFSDGYFGMPAASGKVSYWEDHLAQVERDDPTKTGSVPSTKGSAPGSFTDDRTILILRKDVPRNASA